MSDTKKVPIKVAPTDPPDGSGGTSAKTVTDEVTTSGTTPERPKPTDPPDGTGGTQP